MTFETVDNILTISTDTVMTTAMAGILLLIGFWIKKKVTLLDKYCIPAPVVGGFLFMFITWAGYSTNTFTFNFTNTFQDPFMLAFFTTVGLGASFSLLKKGGVLLIIYWLTAGIISIFQNVIGIAVGTAVGLEAPYALLSSAISMIGGHGAALSYGSTFVKMGYDQGQLVGTVTSVTFKGMQYDIIVDFYGFKWLIQTTDVHNVGEKIGISLDPDAIHIMKKSEYSGMYGDYSSFSNELDELSDAESEPDE